MWLCRYNCTALLARPVVDPRGTLPFYPTPRLQGDPAPSDTAGWGADALLLRDVDGDEIEDVAVLASGELHVRSGETGPRPRQCRGPL